MKQFSVPPQYEWFPYFTLSSYSDPSQYRTQLPSNLVICVFNTQYFTLFAVNRNIIQMLKFVIAVPQTPNSQINITKKAQNERQKLNPTLHQ